MAIQYFLNTDALCSKSQPQAMLTFYVPWGECPIPVQI